MTTCTQPRRMRCHSGKSIQERIYRECQYSQQVNVVYSAIWYVASISLYLDWYSLAYQAASLKLALSIVKYARKVLNVCCISPLMKMQEDPYSSIINWKSSIKVILSNYMIYSVSHCPYPKSRWLAMTWLMKSMILIVQMSKHLINWKEHHYLIKQLLVSYSILIKMLTHVELLQNIFLMVLYIFIQTPSKCSRMPLKTIYIWTPHWFHLQLIGITSINEINTSNSDSGWMWRMVINLS